jgi:hypothetical protein
MLAQHSSGDPRPVDVPALRHVAPATAHRWWHRWREAAVLRTRRTWTTGVPVNPVVTVQRRVSRPMRSDPHDSATADIVTTSTAKQRSNRPPLIARSGRAGGYRPRSCISAGRTGQHELLMEVRRRARLMWSWPTAELPSGFPRRGQRRPSRACASRSLAGREGIAARIPRPVESGVSPALAATRSRFGDASAASSLSGRSASCDYVRGSATVYRNFPLPRPLSCTGFCIRRVFAQRWARTGGPAAAEAAGANRRQSAA